MKEKFNRCDILVCSAGATRAGNFVDLPDEAWLDGYALKLFGCVRMCRLFWPLLKAAQGFVVNIGGGAARSPGADFSIGASVNAAMGNFSKALSQLGKRDGVNVNVIHPGATETERFYQLIEQRSKASGKSVEQLKAGGHRKRRPAPAGQGRGRRRAHFVSLLREGAPHPGHRHRGRWRRNRGLLLRRALLQAGYPVIPSSVPARIDLQPVPRGLGEAVERAGRGLAAAASSRAIVLCVVFMRLASSASINPERARAFATAAISANSSSIAS